MRKLKNKKSKKVQEKDHAFRLSSTSGQLLPLQTIRRRIIGIWQSLNWPTCVKILKANIAVTIALALLLIDPIRHYSSTGGIIASVAVEFVHPTKSYGFLAEDVLLGSIMCCIAASWSILGIFLSSVVRDLENPDLAQPKVCAILACFLVFGCFVLSLFRVKIEQANVGGMLSASIMVISMTSAVTYKEFNPIPTLRLLVPTLVGFLIIFAVFFLLFPENSTKVYMKHCIKTLEKFDDISKQQTYAFLKLNSTEPESLSSIVQKTDGMITTLIERKRMVRREPSYNVIAPVDVSELTAHIKRMRIPIQGLSISRAMESNMQMSEKDIFEAVPFELKKSTWVSTAETTVNSSDRPRSYYGGTDEENDDSLDESSTLGVCSASSSVYNDTSHSTGIQTPRRPASFQKRHTTHEIALQGIGYWKEDYDTVWKLVKPTYAELIDACSLATVEITKRLRKMQNMHPKFQDKPFFYKYYYRRRYGPEDPIEYDRYHDPSVPLLEAIQKFQKNRLSGLHQLFTPSGIPRRTLFLLLKFQLNLHAYAESLYSISSLVYEIDQTRTKRQLWWPHLSFYRWLFRRQTTSESFDLDTPMAVVNTWEPMDLQRAISRRATLTTQSIRFNHDTEAQPTTIYKLNTPHRGHIRSDNTRSKSPSNDQLLDDPLDQLHYHDPDVAYPTTPRQRFFYGLYTRFIKYLYTADIAFALRAAFIVALLSLPGFLEDSVKWYNRVRGQWSVVVAIIWMGPSVGSNFFGTMTRTVGTFIGAIGAMVIWEMSRGKVPGLIILSFVFNLPWWMIYINGKFWKATGLFSLITLSLIIGYAYSFQPDGKPVSVFTVTWERTVDVFVGVLAALIVSIFPYPRTGRVVLRHRIAKTLGEIGALYSSFLTLLIKTDEGDESILQSNRKLFNNIAESIREQIKGERVLLEQSRFEPTLRGNFPEEKYLHILQILETILSLMLTMTFGFDKLSTEWRANLLKNTFAERKAMIAAFLTALHLGSNALINKTPLPPYVMRPTKARRNLTNKARRSPALTVEHLGDRDFTYYGAYLMSSEQLAVEIELLIATIRELVGPDCVSVWLKYKH